MKIPVLYISYDGILEPLGESQVLSYLRELSKGNEFKFFLLSFEKKKDWDEKEKREKLTTSLKGTNINWVPLRYHKKPTVPATAFDIIFGFMVASFLCLKYRIRIVHARSYVPALIARMLQIIFRLSWIFDMRGFWADERVDSGLWHRNSPLYKLVKKFEKRFLLAATEIVSLTQAAVDVMKKIPYLENEKKSYTVIPTCVDLNYFTLSNAPSNNEFVLGYVGSIGLWYDFAPTAKTFEIILEQKPNARFLILSRENPEEIKKYFTPSARGKVEILSVGHKEVPQYMHKMHATAFFIKPFFSKIASAPTKLAEFLACGIPCLTNQGVGDMNKIFFADKVGISIDNYKEERCLRAGIQQFLQLLNEPEIRNHCHNSAVKRFSLESGSAAYKKIYQKLNQH